ncbi:MAG: hypothetical protein LBK40_06245 [Spirochaetaceae bacterium]|jgi:hypothetical protein|nr:hypothetical protein [Spirochaetaceae bacterium]
MFYMIADADIAEEAKWLTDPEVEVRNRRAFRADTLEELAALIQINPSVLADEEKRRRESLSQDTFHEKPGTCCACGFFRILCTKP